MWTPPAPVEAKTEEQLVAETKERYQASANFDRPFKDRCLVAFRNLHNQLPMNWPFWSDHFEPETQINTTETAERIMAGLFPKENFCDLRAMGRQSPVVAEKTKELFLFGLRQKMKYKLTKHRQVTEAVSYGNGVEFHYLEMDVVHNFRRVPVVDEWGVHYGWQDAADQRIEFWPKSKVVSRFDCYPATTGADIQEMPYFIHRELVPVAALQAGMWEGVLRNVDKIEPFLAIDGNRGRAGVEDEDFAYDLYERLRSVGLEVNEGISSAKGTGAVQYCELLFESLAPQRPGMPVRYRIIANRRHLLLDGDHPGWLRKKPYSEIKYLEQSVNLWQGAGLPTLMEPLQRKLNLRSNQASDAIVRNNNPTRIVNPSKLVDQDLTQFDPWPGRVIPAHDILGVVEELERPHVSQDLFADMDLTRASMQRLAKLFDATRNIAGARSGVGKAAQTASGFAQMTQLMQSAHNFKMLLFEEQGILDGLRWHLSLLQQTATTDQQLRVSDDTNPIFVNAGLTDGYITVSPDEVQGEYDVRISGASGAMEDPEKAQIMGAWLSEGLQLPEVGPQIKQLEAWLQKGEWIGVQSPRQFIRTPQELQQQKLQQAAQMQMALQIQQAAAGGMPGAAPAVGGGPAQ
jgi:hypothetical protein